MPSEPIPSHSILVLNSGSSSIKFSIYEAADGIPKKRLEGNLDGIGGKTNFWLKSWLNDDNGKKIVDEAPSISDSATAFTHIQKALDKPEFPRPAAIGHRMVSGGPTVTENQLLTPEIIAEMEQYTAFAPLHAPSEIFLMRRAMQSYPGVPNFVCFDHYFHRHLPEVTRSLPIPAAYAAMGLRRFGAHGLSYESIVAHLEPNVPARLIVAHLGNGASICAIRDGQSVDTSMGLTPTGGIISGTRTGDIDPGVIVFLLRQLANKTDNVRQAADQLEAIVNHDSGLRGLSQKTNDMRELRAAIANGDNAARLAVDEFAYVLRKYIGGYIAVLGGLDMLVFTGGIGEHDPATREQACTGLECLGIVLDTEANRHVTGEATISTQDSRVAVRVIPTAEDLTIVRQVVRLLAG